MEEKKQRKWGQVLAKVVWVIFWLGLFTAMFLIPGVDIGITAIVFGCIGYIAGYVSKRHKDNKEMAEKLFKGGKINLDGATISITTSPDDVGNSFAVTVGPLKEVEEETPTEKPIKKNKKKKKAEQPA
jgi:predicted membrane protein